jgi:PEP-CTERM motif
MLRRKTVGLATVFAILVMLAALASPEALLADSVEYTFTSQLSDGTVRSFQYIAPTFITSDVYINAASMVSCTTSGLFIGPCVAVGILPSGPDDPQHHPEIIFGTPGLVLDFYFPYGSFSAFGQYSEVYNFNPAQLVITDVPTPEPSTALLLCVGLVGLFAWSHRR